MRHLPNLLTLLNLFLGCLAVLCLLSGGGEVPSGHVPIGDGAAAADNPLYLVPWLVMGSIVCDYFDGLLARVLNVKSPIGKELDSLADMVSFGLVPGTILFVLLGMSVNAFALPATEYLRNPERWIVFAGFLVTLFSALRLAKFNVDTRQTSGFVGLPTPSSTVFVLGLLMVFLYGPNSLQPWVLSPTLLAMTSAVLSFLLVAEIPMFSLKFEGGALRGNEERYAALALGLGNLILFGHLAFPLNILLYVLYSAGKQFYFNFFSKKTNPR
jgi:CDP-diacylglycerol--serine O-phosphatidyltransferase